MKKTIVAISLAFASLVTNGAEKPFLLGDFEKAATTDYWKAENRYNSKLTDSVANSDKYAAKGSRSLEVDINSAEASWKESGAIKRYLGEKDLTQFDQITASVYVPKDAPKMQAQISLQTGEKWAWQAGKYFDAVPGEWTTITLDLKKIQDVNNVRICNILIRSPFDAYKGKVYVDSIFAIKSPIKQ